MKRGSTLRIVGCVAILLGVAPYIHVHRLRLFDPPELLSFPIALKRGEYTSPVFNSNVNRDYWLTLRFDQMPETHTNLCKIGADNECNGIEQLVDFDWKIVNDNGVVLQQGNYGKRSERTAWLIVLAGVKGDPGVQRKIILKILRDATELDAFHPTLNIEVPLITAEGFGISWALARIWAFVIGGSGLVIVFGPMIWKSLCAIFPRIESS